MLKGRLEVVEGKPVQEASRRFVIITKERFRDVRHARGMVITIDKKTRKVAIYDSSKQNVQYATPGSNPFNVHDFMDLNGEITVYELQCKTTREPERLEEIRHFLMCEKK